MSDKKRLWKFLQGNRSANGDQTWETGKWYQVEGKLKMCTRGFHASQLIQDALSWVQGSVLAEVEVEGESIIEERKECWSRMRVVQTWPWPVEYSVRLAVAAPRLCLPIFEKQYPGDDRPRKAIEAAEAWLDGTTAADAANAAVRAATYAAADAAADAANAAAHAADAGIDKRRIHQAALEILGLAPARSETKP